MNQIIPILMRQLLRHYLGISLQISLNSLKSNIDEILNFEPKICHRCNLATPTLRYCHEMYGSKFRQFYGWYINQTEFRIGIRTLSLEYIEDYAPENYKIKVDEIKSLYKILSSLNEKNKPFDELLFEEIQSVEKSIGRLKRGIQNDVENITREEFGYRKIGEGNISESILTSIIEKIFPNNLVLRHQRPKWLNGLELDIFIPELNLGIEYQGQQHFYAIKAWGGEESLRAVQQRDEVKRTLCQKMNLRLVEIDYTEPLDINYIKEKISLKL